MSGGARVAVCPAPEPHAAVPVQLPVPPLSAGLGTASSRNPTRTFSLDELEGIITQGKGAEHRLRGWQGVRCKT